MNKQRKIYSKTKNEQLSFRFSENKNVERFNVTIYHIQSESKRNRIKIIERILKETKSF